MRIGKRSYAKMFCCGSMFSSYGIDGYLKVDIIRDMLSSLHSEVAFNCSSLSDVSWICSSQCFPLGVMMRRWYTLVNAKNPEHILKNLDLTMLRPRERENERVFRRTSIWLGRSCSPTYLR